MSIARLGAFEWDLSTSDVFLDERSRQIFEFPSSGAIKAEEIFARIHPKDLDHVQASAMKSIETAIRLELEYRVVLSDGTVRIVQSINDPIVDEQGKSERMVGVFSDVTESRRAKTRCANPPKNTARCLNRLIRASASSK